MSVSTTNKQYNTMLPIWNKTRSAESGSNAIKGGGTKYLPQLNGHEDDDYDKYKGRTVYYNFTGKTATGLKGMVFRKEPVIQISDELTDISEHITPDGKSLTDLMQSVVSELINPSRVGILMDLPVQSTDGMTMQQVSELNIQPYLSMYVAESIINWRTETINNVKMLTMCVLKEESEEVNESDRFTTTATVNYRVLELIDNVYTVTIYDDGGSIIGESIQPVINGVNLNYIPFWILNQNGESIDIVSKPVIDDIADINIAHYVNSADYENALHWSGVRTVIVEGWPEDQDIKMGSAFGVPLGAKAYFLTAPTDDALSSAMERKEGIMVSMGASLITKATGDVTATSSVIQHQGEMSTITDIANNVSRVMTMIMKIFNGWIGNEDSSDINIKLNIDYNPLKMTGQEALALMQVFQGGGIDRNTLNYNYRKGEIIPANVSDEDLDANIKKEASDNEANLFNIPQ